LLLSVIAYNLGNLLRRLVLPLAIQSWSLTSLQQRLFQRPAGASAAHFGDRDQSDRAIVITSIGGS
jgi:hypothetical protein